MTTRDAFLGGRLQLQQPSHGFRSGSDAVFLAATVPARAGDDVLDLGCGAGAVMYALAARVAGLDLVGVERDPEAVTLARDNGPAEVVEADVFDLPPAIRNRQFAHVVTNPPYFEAGAGSGAADAGREAGLREAEPGALGRWVEVACRRAAPKGTVSVIARADRLPDILAPMAGTLGGIVICPLAARADGPAKRIICQGVKGSRAPLSLRAPLVLHGPDGTYLPQADSILRNAQALPLR